MKIKIDKPVVPKWFDDWYKAMKYAEHSDVFILKVISSVNRYGGYCDYSRDNVFFNTDQFTYISENSTNVINAIQFGYEVEQEPLYYAKIKGWELSTSKSTFWNYRYIVERPILSRLFVGSKESADSFKTKMTIEQWNEAGINETNADFEKVE